MPLTLNSSTRIIIRVWTSEKNKRYPGNGVGHVSIEYDGGSSRFYVSLFPIPFSNEQILKYREEKTIEEEYLKYFTKRESGYKQTFSDDMNSETGHPPNITVCLYSLDAVAMQSEFQKLSTSVKHWQLIRNNLFVQTLDVLELLPESRKNVENCASLVYKILKAGEINSLLTTAEEATFCSKISSVKPDDIGDLVITAKLSEIKQHPETNNFKFNSETLLSPQNKSRRCSYFWPIVTTSVVGAGASVVAGTGLGIGFVAGAMVGLELNRRGCFSRC